MSLSPAPAMKAIFVNLNVNLDASGDVVILGDEVYTPSNPIVPSVKLPVEDLYDASSGNSLFEFQEPTNSTGIRKGYLASHEDRDYKLLVPALAQHMQDVFEGSFDCSEADPFKGYGSAAYKSVGSIGDLALKLYAHHLLGHVAATAAITNDQAIIDAAEFTSLAHPIASFADADRATWAAVVGTSTEVEIVKRLLGQLLTKADGAATADQNEGLNDIVNQVLGRDANRAINEDNNQNYGPDEWAPLKFIAGDKICMELTFVAPGVTLGGIGNGTSGQQVSAGTIASRYPAYGDVKTKFTVVIELE